MIRIVISMYNKSFNLCSAKTCTSATRNLDRIQNTASRIRERKAETERERNVKRRQFLRSFVFFSQMQICKLTRGNLFQISISTANTEKSFLRKQGRTHGYPSRVRVGRGRI